MMHDNLSIKSELICGLLHNETVQHLLQVSGRIVLYEKEPNHPTEKCTIFSFLFVVPAATCETCKAIKLHVVIERRRMPNSIFMAKSGPTAAAAAEVALSYLTLCDKCKPAGETRPTGRKIKRETKIVLVYVPYVYM